MKVSLGSWNWALVSYCLVVTQASQWNVPYVQKANCQLPMPKATLNMTHANSTTQISQVWKEEYV